MFKNSTKVEVRSSILAKFECENASDLETILEQSFRKFDQKVKMRKIPKTKAKNQE